MSNIKLAESEKISVRIEKKDLTYADDIAVVMSHHLEKNINRSDIIRKALSKYIAEWRTGDAN